jgi:hypothetical protein
MADTSQTSINATGAIIGVGMLILVALLEYVIGFRTIPDGNKELLSTMLGLLGNGLAVVVGFYFGSSANNKKLADTNNVQAQTINAAQAALAPVSDKTLNIEPGQTASVTAKDPK